MAAFAWPVLAAVDGIHHLQPEAGPAGPAGWAKSAAGALQCRWGCTACGKAATNIELLCSPDGLPGEWQKMHHDAQAVGGRISCSRCGTTRQPHVQLGRQKCPVWELFRGGVEVPEATATFAEWQTTVKGMHRCSRTAAAAEVPAAGSAAIARPVEAVQVAEPVVLA